VTISRKYLLFLSIVGIEVFKSVIILPYPIMAQLINQSTMIPSVTVTFKINPPDEGQIYCDDNDNRYTSQISHNDNKTYYFGTKVNCQAKSNNTFISWSGMANSSENHYLTFLGPGLLLLFAPCLVLQQFLSTPFSFLP
jgi:hypothetical protein